VEAFLLEVKVMMTKGSVSSQRFKSLDEFMGGRGGGGRGGPPKEVDNTKYYTLLNCEKTATTDEVKKAFRKVAIKAHPDKGGDVEIVNSLLIYRINLVQRNYSCLRSFGRS
jgi:hypothetical protein